MNRLKSFISIFITIIMLVMLFNFPAAANGVSAPEKLREPDGGAIGVASKGLWREYPENSLEGIAAAAKTGIDFVLADLKFTSDGTAVLFSDDSGERMLGTNKAICDMSYAELSGLKLKDGCGGISAEYTQYTVPTLEAALKAAKAGGFYLMLSVSAGDIAAVTQILCENAALESTPLLIDADYKEIKAQTDSLAQKPMIIGVKRSNVIFSVNSYVNKMYENGAVGVNLKTTNRYGVNFRNGVLGGFEGRLRAAANTAQAETCGAREDSEKWWNDLISRGYSIIITNEPELFCDYMSRTSAAKAALSSLYKKYTDEWKLPEFKSEIFNDYKKAYTDAVSDAAALLSDNASALSDISDCTAALQKAVDNIKLNYEALQNGTAGVSVTPVRIMLCAAAAAAVIAVQIFFFKKRKKAN